MKKILTIHGDAIIDTSEIIVFMPKVINEKSITNPKNIVLL